MEGDIAPLPALCDLAEKYNCIMMVDDAHSSGVLGSRGRGTVDHLGCHGRVDIQVGTLSKAIGSIGGYVCGSRDLIDFLYHRGRPFLFSTSHPPSVVATCQAAFELLDSEAGEKLIKKLWSNTKFFKRKSEEARIQHRQERDAHHPDHGRRCGKAFQFAQELFPGRSVCQARSAIQRSPKEKRACARSSPPRTSAPTSNAPLEILERVGKKLAII